jgi:uncharacterized protein YdeI (YjbR/CyaY-like superfamily)
MKVPFAKQWQPVTDQLRKIALAAGLTEETKWSKPCFTWQGGNVAIIIPLKESCALSFFKGALLKDPKGILQRVGEHAQAGRWIKFTSTKEVAALKATLGKYLKEAIAIEKSGAKVAMKKASDYAIPAELQARFDAVPRLRVAFDALTPGRRKSWLFYIAGAKQSATRAARVEKSVPKILAGRGFFDRP